MSSDATQPEQVHWTGKFGFILAIVALILAIVALVIAMRNSTKISGGSSGGGGGGNNPVWLVTTRTTKTTTDTFTATANSVYINTSDSTDVLQLTVKQGTTGSATTGQLFIIDNTKGAGDIVLTMVNTSGDTVANYNVGAGNARQYMWNGTEVDSVRRYWVAIQPQP